MEKKTRAARRAATAERILVSCPRPSPATRPCAPSPTSQRSPSSTSGLRIGLTQYDADRNLAYVDSNGGGTSLSSPLFAGIEALLVQEHCPLGFASPAFCSRAGTFHCITDNQAGTPDTIAYAVNEFDGVVLAAPRQ